MNSSDSPFRCLQHGFVGMSGDDYLVGVSPQLDGVGVIVVGDADELPNADSVLDVESHPGGLNGVVDQAASQGATGLIFVGTGTVFPFVCRLEEVGRDRPTALGALSVEGQLIAVLTPFRSGPPNDVFVRWRRFDLTDAAFAPPGGRQPATPFLGWKPGDPLYELCAGDAMPMFGEIAAHNPWPTPYGSFTLFTSEEAALAWWKSGVSAAFAWAHQAGADLDRAASSIALREVGDFSTWSRELGRGRSGTPIVIDPGSSRPFVGLGSAGSPLLRTVVGVWRFAEANMVGFEQPWQLWTRRDSLHWHGTDAIQARALDRTLAATAMRATPEWDPQDVAQQLLDGKPQPPETFRDAYVLGLADTMTTATTWRLFSDWASATRWLLHYEGSTDRQARIEGFEPEYELGRIGSHDPDAEDTTGMALATAMERIARRIAAHGYVPNDGRELAAAANATLRTVRVEVAGHVTDLLWMAAEDAIQFDRILDLAGDEGPAVETWLQQTGALPVDGQGQALASDRVGPDVWARLAPRSQYFLATALATWQKQRHSVALDSAPIVVEIVKSLEVELGDLFAAFREQCVEIPKHDPDDRNDAALHRYLTGGQKLTLGQMQYLLKRGSSPLREAFLAFLLQQPNGEYLTGKPLFKALFRCLNDYRNSAAHDSPVDAATAERAINEIAGTNERPGLLAHVTAWRPDAPPPRSRPPVDWGKSADQWWLRRDYPDEAVVATADPDLAEFRQLLGHELAHGGALADHAEIAALGADVSELQQALSTRWERLGDDDESRIDRLFMQAVERPELESFCPLGVLERTESEIAARLSPRVFVGKTPYGTLKVGYFHTTPGDVSDVFLVELARASVHGLAKAVRRRHIDWTHPKGLLSVIRPGEAATMAIRFRRTGPPGGHVRLELPPDSAELLIDVVQEVAGGTLGELLPANAPPPLPWQV